MLACRGIVIYFPVYIPYLSLSCPTCAARVRSFIELARRFPVTEALIKLDTVTNGCCHVCNTSLAAGSLYHSCLHPSHIACASERCLMPKCSGKIIPLSRCGVCGGADGSAALIRPMVCEHFVHASCARKITNGLTACRVCALASVGVRMGSASVIIVDATSSTIFFQRDATALHERSPAVEEPLGEKNRMR